MDSLAPVVLFTYKRLSVTKRVIDSLKENEESSRTDLIVYSDGPKTPGDLPAVEETRRYLQGLSGFRSVKLIFRESNLGLAQSFIGGITETLAQHEKAIFIEDDNLLSRYFLSFMNKALNHYQGNEKVICVTGYSYPLFPRPRRPYFLRGAETWSMGTWRRGWQHFCANGKELLSQLHEKRLLPKFSSDGFGYYPMLQEQIRGSIDSWGVRWWTSAFVNDRYCLYPDRPLCVSIGYGEDSVHCSSYDPLFRGPEDLAQQPVTELPDDVREKAITSLNIRMMNKRIAVVSWLSRHLDSTKKPAGKCCS